MVVRQATQLGAILALPLAAGACTANGEPAQDASLSVEEFEMNHPSDGNAQEGGVANLPYARGRVFRSLDEYLEHLEANGAIDLPYWREVRPGLYEWMVRMPEAGGRETATREELVRRYGFTR